MAILGLAEAEYFCRSYAGATGAAAGSFRLWSETQPTNTVFREGTPQFALFRDLALREVERLLFLAASQYRRSFDLMVPSAAGWAHVTMYYGAYYAASALLGMFGASKLPRGNLVIDVVRAQPGAQEFKIHNQATTYNGSHRKFWDFFYANVSSLIPWIDPPSLVPAISPVLQSRVWLTDTRNSINYDSHANCDLALNFKGAFRRSAFPASLPGAINTQYAVLEGLLRITARFAREFHLETNALNLLEPSGNRRSRVRKLVLEAITPSLQHKVRRRAVIG